MLNPIGYTIKIHQNRDPTDLGSHKYHISLQNHTFLESSRKDSQGYQFDLIENNIRNSDPFKW